LDLRKKLCVVNGTFLQGSFVFLCVFWMVNRGELLVKRGELTVSFRTLKNITFSNFIFRAVPIRESNPRFVEAIGLESLKLL
jgi:hypothetical protein